MQDESKRVIYGRMINGICYLHGKLRNINLVKTFIKMPNYFEYIADKKIPSSSEKLL